MRTFFRRKNESLIIDENIQVTVLEVFPDHVRLAIVSPNAEVRYREEDVYFEKRELQLQ